MIRGDRREVIFKDDQDRQGFVETLGECCGRTGWEVHALCLMPNHFHLVVETPLANLVAGMKWLLGVYTGRFNRRHKLFGHLFSGRYKSLVVDGSGTGYFKTVCDYVHLNPARAKKLGQKQALREYRWSSWPEYLKRPKQRWPWLRVDHLLGEYRIPKDSAAGRRRLERCVEERRMAEDPRAYQPVRRGWCLGDKRFKKELLAEMAGGLGKEHYGEERRENEAEKAERIVLQELRRAGWDEEKLESSPKGHRVKVRVAVRLRRETTVTYGWIAERLQMGSRSNASNLVYASPKCQK
jgi:REP element-mobilizing transposase RayT